MLDWLREVTTEFLTAERLALGLRVVAVLVIGIVIVRILAGVVGRVLKRRASPQTAMVVRKAVFYTGTVLIAIGVLQQLGVQLGALLGAAGIAGVAIGFAAQTSMSNLISGIFLISEKPFAVGDFIRVGQTSGTVMSIDLLSIKVRTPDNLFVRVANSTVINTDMTNFSYFPIRRMDIRIGVGYQQDVAVVHDTLLALARENPHCLDDPEPLIIFTDFGDSALEFLFAIWFQKSDYLALKNSIMRQIKERFDALEIEIPYPQRTIHFSNPAAELPPSCSSQT